MRPLGLLAAWTATLCLAFPAPAWNSTGHRIIAAIAYERLNSTSRAHVDELILNHPDYGRFIRGAPEDPAARARAAFIAAAVWADDIKGDRRFWDDTPSDAHQTPTLPGFPDMKRHINWHYYDTPYAPDHAHVDKQRSPNALTEMRRLIREIGTTSRDAAVYDLPWIEHIVGDVHQPLHCVSRFLKSEANRDAGGNTVILDAQYGRGAHNLHALWDESPGNDPSDLYVTKYAADATAEHPAPPHPETNPKKWIQEGFAVAKTEVYTFGNRTGSIERPLHLPESYVENSGRVARAQVAMAGYRLAAVLNAIWLQNTRKPAREH